jgi:membrane protein YdbS with pleckstrin-like domain
MSEPFDPADITWTRVSPRLATARITTTSIVFGVPVIILAVVAVLTGEPWTWLPVVLLGLVWLWLVLLIRRQVRAIGYAERADDLLVRRGIMFRQLVVVPYGRMQYVDVTAGPLARRFGFAAVQLHTASPATTASIDGLAPEEAARLRERLASRGEARLAGL